MCGILAYSSAKPDASHLRTLSALFRESKVRGLHAFGVSFDAGSGIRTAKFHDISGARGFVEGLPISGPLNVIGHCRYSTSGDYKEHANNQPIHIGDVSVAFNGVIDMGTKDEMERRHGVSMQTYNDGELFLLHVASGGDPVEFVRGITGSFAGVFLRGGRAYALRNERRPAHAGALGGAAFVASTADIFRRAGFAGRVSEVAPGVLYDLAGGL